MSSSYRIELDKWLRTLDVNAGKVLDIGGSQLPVKGRTRSWDVEQYLIGDLPEPHVNSPMPDLEIDLNYEWRNYSDSGVAVASFDMLFCLEVFDYVWNPAQAFKNIATLLEDHGTAWVTFPTIYPLHQPVEDDALRYMPAGIEKLAAAVELEVVQMIKRRPETKLWESFYRGERMRAAKHEDHQFTGLIVELRKPA